jgi:glutamyl-tRNA reductase
LINQLYKQKLLELKENPENQEIHEQISELYEYSCELNKNSITSFKHKTPEPVEKEYSDLSKILLQIEASGPDELNRSNRENDDDGKKKVCNFL